MHEGAWPGWFPQIPGKDVPLRSCSHITVAVGNWYTWAGAKCFSGGQFFHEENVGISVFKNFYVPNRLYALKGM